MVTALVSRKTTLCFGQCRNRVYLPGLNRVRVEAYRFLVPNCQCKNGTTLAKLRNSSPPSHCSTKSRQPGYGGFDWTRTQKFFATAGYIGQRGKNVYHQSTCKSDTQWKSELQCIVTNGVLWTNRWNYKLSGGKRTTTSAIHECIWYFGRLADVGAREASEEDHVSAAAASKSRSRFSTDFYQPSHRALVVVWKHTDFCFHTTTDFCYTHIWLKVRTHNCCQNRGSLLLIPIWWPFVSFDD